MKKRGDFVYLLVIVLVLVASVFAIKYMSITGHAVNKPNAKFSAHKQHFRFDFADQQSSVVKELKLDEFPDNSVLKSLKVTGKASGFFRVWLATPKGKFLVIDSHSVKKNDLKSGVTSITAYAVKSKQGKNKDGNSNDNDNGKGNDKKGKDKGDDGGNNDDGNNNGGNDDNNNGNNNNDGDTGNDSGPDNDESSTNNKDSTELKSNPETKAPFSRAEMEKTLEAVYGPSWLTPKDKQSFQRATEPDKVFNTVTFEGVCQGSCSLPDGLTKDSMHLEIELDGSIELKEISYELENIVADSVVKSIVKSVNTVLSPPQEPEVSPQILQQSPITGLAVQEEGVNSNVFLGLAFIAVLTIGLILFTATRD